MTIYELAFLIMIFCIKKHDRFMNKIIGNYWTKSYTWTFVTTFPLQMENIPKRTKLSDQITANTTYDITTMTTTISTMR